MKNASGSSKSQMLPRLLPASFFKVLPLPQKFNRFHRFHVTRLCDKSPRLGDSEVK